MWRSPRAQLHPCASGQRQGSYTSQASVQLSCATAISMQIHMTKPLLCLHSDAVLKQSSGTMIYCHFIIESNKHTFKAPGCPWWRSPPTGWASFNKAEPAMHIALVYISTFHPKLEKSLWWAFHIIQNSLCFQIVVTHVGPAKTWSGLNFEILVK